MYINKDCENLLQHCTAIIDCLYNDGTRGHATSFFIKTNLSKMFLVTNYHVVENCKKITILLTITKNGETQNNFYEIQFEEDLFVHPKYDICMIDMTDVYKEISNEEGVINIDFIKEEQILIDYSEMSLLQDVIMVGYPNGIYDECNNAPIIRTGHLATNIRNKFNELEQFQIDIATVNGSSGSPVFTINKEGELFLIGINRSCFNHHSKVVEEYKNPHSKIIGYVDVPNHIGTVINSKIIQQLLTV